MFLHYPNNVTEIKEINADIIAEFYQPCDPSETESSNLEELLTGRSAWEDLEQAEALAAIENSCDNVQTKEIPSPGSDLQSPTNSPCPLA